MAQMKATVGEHDGLAARALASKGSAGSIE